MRDVRAVLADATRRLAAAGVPSPRVDAEVLLAALLERPRSRLLTLPEIPEPVLARYDAWLDRRCRREPLQHLLGVAPFRRIEVAVGPGVFIPRPETELLVDAVLPHLSEFADPFAVDLCAGSGALALAIADEVPGARVLAVEASPDALAYLRRNAAGSAVHAVRADVRDPAALRDYAGTADAVVANPPYVPGGVDIAAEVAADPPQAVFAGADGLAVLPAVVDRAAELLRPGGAFAMEHDESHGTEVVALLAADDRWTELADHLDLAERPRYVTAVRTNVATPGVRRAGQGRP